MTEPIPTTEAPPADAQAQNAGSVLNNIPAPVKAAGAATLAFAAVAAVYVYHKFSKKTAPQGAILDEPKEVEVPARASQPKGADEGGVRDSNYLDLNSQTEIKIARPTAPPEPLQSAPAIPEDDLEEQPQRKQADKKKKKNNKKKGNMKQGLLTGDDE
jgi:hypothetical protein